MRQDSEKSYARGYGKLPLVHTARFTPVNGADPTIIHTAGIETIARAAEGQWDLTLSNNVTDVLASGFPFAITHVDITAHTDTTADADHVMSVISINDATGVVRIGHKTGAGNAALAFDDVAGGLTGISVAIWGLEA